MNPPILATRNLGLDIGGAQIVADVSLEVAEGELLGIIGPNGAGKTSLFNLFSGLYRPTAGSIELNGVDITHQPTFRRTREGIGRTFQVSSVFPLLTTLRERPARGGGGARRHAPALAPRGRASSGALERASAALARVGLEAQVGGHGRRRSPTATSGGSRSRCCSRRTSRCCSSTSRWPASPPSTCRSSSSSSARCTSEERKTVLMVEHHIDVVTGLAQRIAVMHHGALLAVRHAGRGDGERDRAVRLSRRGAVSAVATQDAALASATCTCISGSRTCCRA